MSSYFLNFSANFAATAHDITVIPIGNIPLVRICGTCSSATDPELYIAAATGKATSPTTPSLVLVCSEATFCCMLYVLIVITSCKGVTVLRWALTISDRLVQLLIRAARGAIQLLNSDAHSIMNCFPLCENCRVFFRVELYCKKE